MGIGPYEAFLALDWLGPLKRVQTMGRLSAAGVDNLALFQTEHERGMAQLHTGLDLESRGGRAAVRAAGLRAAARQLVEPGARDDPLHRRAHGGAGRAVRGGRLQL